MADNLEDIFQKPIRKNDLKKRQKINVILVVKYLTGISNKWYDLSMIYFFNEYESFIKKRLTKR